MNPKSHLDYYSQVYPDAWKQIDNMRADRGKELPFWPEWCFLPLSGAYAIVTAEADAQGVDIHNPEYVWVVNDVGVIGALAAWRVTQGVYRFDPDVYKAVIDTPITGDLPHDVLFNLPEWCIYIEAPGLSYMGADISGFYAYLEYDARTYRKELRFVMDMVTPPDVNRPMLISQALHLGDWSLLESVDRAAQEAQKHATTKLCEEVYASAVSALQAELMPLVSLLLYICSVNGDIGNGKKMPTRPTPVNTRKGLRLFPPSKATTWDVGVRMGAALRQAQEVAREAETQEQVEGKHRSSPKPHVRRAHWSTYWTGPKSGQQKAILKWLSPMLIGEGDIPVTIRRRIKLAERKRQPKKLPKIISREDMRKILDIPNVKCITGLRNRVILQILYRGALRVEELCNLSLQDIILPPPGVDAQEGYIYVQQGKGAKDRYVVIDAETVAWLRLWMDKRLPGEYLFNSHRGAKLDQSYVRKLVYMCAEKAGVCLQDGKEKARVHPHTLRACYATERLEEGKNIIYIQEQLGHSSLATTRIYTQIRPALRRQIAENIEPIGGFPV
ncbi:MAG: hypothetical protein HPY66_1683 [Firmicutes bacterium]|nr:hypothetical protein [Bacillota bacterium]